MSDQTLWLAGLLLLAIVVGMLLVVLFELWRAIRRLAPKLGRATDQARRSLAELESAAQRVNRIGEVLEGEGDLQGLAATLREASQSLRRVNRMLHVASAAGTAVAPAVAAFLAVLSEQRERPQSAAPTASAAGTAARQEAARRASAA